jgi:hypothetical protein
MVTSMSYLLPSILPFGLAIAMLDIPHRFPAQVLPPQLAGAPPHHRVRRRQLLYHRRPNPVSFRAPFVAKWTPRGCLLLLVSMAYRLTAGNAGAAGPVLWSLGKKPAQAKAEKAKA